MLAVAMPPHDVPALFSRARAALNRGQSPEVIRLLSKDLRVPGRSRAEELAVRTLLAEAWLLHGDVKQASLALGHPPDGLRAPIQPAHLAAAWRLHGQIAATLGEQSRAIALLKRALSQAERSHDAREIGLANYELFLCYRRVGDTATVREHLTKASTALHAAGDRRHLALAHSLSGITLAEDGRYEAAMAALRQAERIATGRPSG